MKIRSIISIFALLPTMIMPSPAKLETLPIINPLVAAPGVPVSLLEPQEQTTLVRLIEGLSADRTAPLFSLPLDWDTVDSSLWRRPHHDYPAIDVVVPVGTPVFAVTNGTVTTATRSDGAACGGTVRIRTYIGDLMYCHLSGVVVSSGAEVQAGDLIGYTGGRPGAYGAGSSTTPHLHLEIVKNGRRVCPQLLLSSIINGEEPNLNLSYNCYY